LHRIHFPTPFPNPFPLPWVLAFPTGQDLFALLFFNFVGEKKEKDKMKNMTF
jgi:hypothetical protein